MNTGIGGTPATGEWQIACRVEDLADGACAQFSLSDTPGFVLLHGDLACAYINRCPHLGIELNWMPNRFKEADGHFIQCATHGALFTPDRGDCIAGPCQGDALTALETRQQDGYIWVRFTPD
ncbi:Rieske (2Fe-2S) protein [Marinobacter caseinilyticus]|uniref:Rieske (2Fe-2S) protein n=1 Tax=Marinobacter caseinilyticus TaxID=2692195 RepID=UPI00140D8DDB|nr:Rieske 2Fe-2S domain-containing protein [Marinobacter caseinilyticus]